MRDDATRQALDALYRADERTKTEVLGMLAGTRPEAVLAAVEAVQRHREVVAGLLAQRPPTS